MNPRGRMYVKCICSETYIQTSLSFNGKYIVWTRRSSTGVPPRVLMLVLGFQWKGLENLDSRVSNLTRFICICRKVGIRMNFFTKQEMYLTACEYIWNRSDKSLTLWRHSFSFILFLQLSTWIHFGEREKCYIRDILKPNRTPW